MNGPKARDEIGLALDAILGSAPERARAEAELARCSRGPAQRRTLSAALERTRAYLLAGSGWSEGRERRWRAALLAQTTRQDLSWRGDVRLVWDFLRQRMEASPALRLVAASLVLHVVAAPAVAYWVLREPASERRLVLRIERPAESPFAPEPAAPTLAEDELVAQAHQREAYENQRVRERFVLSRCAPRAPRVAAESLSRPEVRLLAQRGARLAGAQSTEFELGWEDLEPLALALWLELQCDGHVLGSGEPRALGPAAARAALEAELIEGERPATAALVRMAVSRAARLGLVDSAGLEDAELLSPPWFELLDAAAGEQGLATDGVWRAWLDWNGKQVP